MVKQEWNDKKRNKIIRNGILKQKQSNKTGME